MRFFLKPNLGTFFVNIFLQDLLFQAELHKIPKRFN